MATYYFDSVNGNDANTGLSWEQAWSGASKQISTYIGSGNTIWLKGYWSNQIFGTYTGLTNFELRVHPDGAVLDCRTRHNTGWTNVSGTRVWKKTYAHQIHRVFLGSSAVHGFTEGSDAAKKAVQVSYNAGVAATDGEVVTVLNTASVNQSKFWYWDAISDTFYVRSTDSSTNPDAAYGGLWTCDGSDSSSADRRRFYTFKFVNCTGLYFGPVEVRGAVHPIQLENTGGVLEPFITDFPHYQWPTITCQGAAAGTGPSLTINNPQIFTRRPYFADDILQVQGFDDGNGFRNQGGADLIVISSRWNTWEMLGGVIEGGIHGAVSSQWYHNAYVVSGLIRGTYFDLSQQRYGRGLNFQQSAAGRITSFIIENCTFNGQNVTSQLMWDNLIVRNCVWRNGRFGWFGDGTGPNIVDKYHPTHNWFYRWRNGLCIQFFKDSSAVVATGLVVEDCIFYGQYDEPLGLDDGRVTPGITIRNNWFIKVNALAGPFGDRVIKNYSGASATYSGNKYFGYSAVGYVSVPSGFTAMTAGEEAIYAAKALAHVVTLTPSSVSVGTGSSTNSTATITDTNSASVSGWTGTVVSVNPSIATASITGTTVTVNGVSVGSTSIEVKGTAGSLTKTLPVSVTSGVPISPGDINIVQSKINTATNASSVSVTLDSAPATGNLLAVFIGGFLNGTSTVNITDNRSNSYTQQQLQQNGTTGIHAGVWTCLPSVVTGPFTVTATPAAGSGHFISICVVELNKQATSSFVNGTGFSTGTGISSFADMPTSTTLRGMLLGGFSWLFGGDGVTTGNVANAVAPNLLVQKRDRSAGLAVVSRYLSSIGKYDPQVSLDIPDQWVGVGIYIAENVVQATSGQPPVFRNRKRSKR